MHFTGPVHARPLAQDFADLVGLK